MTHREGALYGSFETTAGMALIKKLSDSDHDKDAAMSSPSRRSATQFPHDP